MNKTYTCILCPNGCEISVNYTEDGFSDCSGNLCKNGEKYVRQELTSPCRTISTSVIVENGEFPLVSVRLTKPIPLGRIHDVVEYIHSIRVTAPIHIGSVIERNILNLGSDLIATKNVDSQ